MKKLIVALLLGCASLAAKGQDVEVSVQTILNKYMKGYEGYRLTFQETTRADTLALAEIAKGNIAPIPVAGAKDLAPDRRGDVDEAVLQFVTKYGSYYFASNGVFCDKGAVLIGNQLRPICLLYKPTKRELRQAKKILRGIE